MALSKNLSYFLAKLVLKPLSYFLAKLVLKPLPYILAKIVLVNVLALLKHKADVFAQSPVIHDKH